MRPLKLKNASGNDHNIEFISLAEKGGGVILKIEETKLGHFEGFTSKLHQLDINKLRDWLTTQLDDYESQEDD